MTRTAKQHKRLGKVSRVYTIKKENDKKVKVKQKEMRDKVSGRDVQKITASYVVDSLIENSL